MKRYKVEYQWRPTEGGRIDGVQEFEFRDNMMARENIFQELIASQHETEAHLIFIKDYIEIK